MATIPVLACKMPHNESTVREGKAASAAAAYDDYSVSSGATTVRVSNTTNVDDWVDERDAVTRLFSALANDRHLYPIQFGSVLLAMNMHATRQWRADNASLFIQRNIDAKGCQWTGEIDRALLAVTAMPPLIWRDVSKALVRLYVEPNSDQTYVPLPDIRLQTIPQDDQDYLDFIYLGPNAVLDID